MARIKLRYLFLVWWYHHVPWYCRPYAEGNHRLGTKLHEDQDCCSSRTQVLRLDRWFHLGFPFHLPGMSLHEIFLLCSKANKVLLYQKKKGYVDQQTSKYTLGCMWVCQERDVNRMLHRNTTNLVPLLSTASASKSNALPSNKNSSYSNKICVPHINPSMFFGCFSEGCVHSISKGRIRLKTIWFFFQ